MTHLNSNLAELVIVDTNELPWQDSGMPGRQIKWLEQFGIGSNRMTGLTQYEAGFERPLRNYPHGAEAFVIEGEFNDEFGRHRAGTYLRAAGGVAQHLKTDSGATVFFKFGHILGADTNSLMISPDEYHWQRRPEGQTEKVELASFGSEVTSVTRTAAGSQSQATRFYGGYELLLLSGTLDMTIDGVSYECPQGTWLRSPHRAEVLRRSESDAMYWLKTGHLPSK